MVKLRIQWCGYTCYTEFWQWCITSSIAGFLDFHYIKQSMALQKLDLFVWDETVTRTDTSMSNDLQCNWLSPHFFTSGQNHTFQILCYICNTDWQTHKVQKQKNTKDNIFTLRDKSLFELSTTFCTLYTPNSCTCCDNSSQQRLPKVA